MSVTIALKKPRRRRRSTWLVAGLTVAALGLSACDAGAPTAGEQARPREDRPGEEQRARPPHRVVGAPAGAASALGGSVARP